MREAKQTHCQAVERLDPPCWSSMLPTPVLSQALGPVPCIPLPPRSLVKAMEALPGHEREVALSAYLKAKLSGLGAKLVAGE